MPFYTAFSMLVLGGIIMGASPIFVREAEVGAFASAFWRVLIAVPALLLWMRIEHGSAKIKFTKPAVFAGAMFAGDLVFWHLAILNTTIANATFMVCLAPVWVALFSNRLIDERNSNKTLLGLSLCLAGLALLINASFQIDPSRLLGDIYGLITSVFLGLYFIAIRAGRKTTSGSELFLSSTVITTAILFIVTIAMRDALLPETANGWTSLLALGLLTHVGGQGLVTLAIGSLTAVFSSLVIYLEAITAAVAGWLVYSEAFTPLQMFGGCLILAGIWYCRPEK